MSARGSSPGAPRSVDPEAFGKPGKSGMYELTSGEVVALSARHGHSFYLFDERRFGDNLTKISNAFRSRYDRFGFGYSVKTNYLPRVCQIARAIGGLAEVVSPMEYELAEALGFAGTEIVFNGPTKPEAYIRRALEAGSILNIDSLSELDRVVDACAVRPELLHDARIGIRVNVDLTRDDGVSSRQEGLGDGRFGMSRDDIELAAGRLHELGIPIRSLHGHSSSSDRKLRNFEKITRELCDVRDALDMDELDIFDVGGGFFGEVDPSLGITDAPSFDDYAATIVDIMLGNPWVRENRPTLLIEPGVSVVANAFSIYSRIESIKRVNDTSFVTVDASIYNVKPTMHRFTHPTTLIRTGSGSDGRELPEQSVFNVVGSTCMEKDVLSSDVALDSPGVGDFIRFDNVGAYTLVMTPPFINLAPAIVSVDSERRFRTVRVAQTFENFLECYRLTPPVIPVQR